MSCIDVQIYEIQDPLEAEIMVRLGVDRIGSVLVSPDDWKIQSIRDAMAIVKDGQKKSSLIPLFSDFELIQRVIEWYEPDVIHFCENLSGKNGIFDRSIELIRIQEKVKTAYPGLMIMRSIPIGEKNKAHLVPTLELARMFEDVSDEFLTDTLIVENDGQNGVQPVSGFVGITGITCDLDMARRLVEQSCIPVILAGGLSPDNVYDAALHVRPSGVDSCTRTNMTDSFGKPIRFKKDPEKVRVFVEQARKAGKLISEITTQ